MRRWKSTLVMVVLAMGVGFAHAELLFDNYLPTPDGWYDSQGFFTSEVSAAIDDSWAGDDACFAYPVTIEAVEWLAMRKPNYDYTAELIILDEDFETVATFSEAAGQLTLTMTDITDPDFPWGYTPYEGHVDIAAEDQPYLPAGHYYVAVRLVSGTVEEPTGGRNFVLTTGNGTLNDICPELTEGIVKVPDYGCPDWTFISEYDGYDATDYAYRIWGVPEPISLMLLTTPLLLARRR